MKHSVRSRTIQIVGSLGAVAALFLGNHAFDTHSMPLVLLAVGIGFLAIGSISYARSGDATNTRRDLDPAVSDLLERQSQYNPATGLPMLDGVYDVQGNLFGTRSSESHDFDR